LYQFNVIECINESIKIIVAASMLVLLLGKRAPTTVRTLLLGLPAKDLYSMIDLIGVYDPRLLLMCKATLVCVCEG
jgi:hypothetical protein